MYSSFIFASHLSLAFRYVYKVCPFNQASQVEGHSTTQLGLVLNNSYVLCVYLVQKQITYLGL